MQPSLVEFLQHIQIEIDFCRSATAGLSFDNFMEDSIRMRAVVRSLEIIGEATKKIPPDFTCLFPLVSWKEMAGMRDRLIHNYFGVDYEIVWNTVHEDLEVLQIWMPLMINAAVDH